MARSHVGDIPIFGYTRICTCPELLSEDPCGILPLKNSTSPAFAVILILYFIKEGHMSTISIEDDLA